MSSDCSSKGKGKRGKSGKDVSEVTTEKPEEDEQVTKELGGIELGGQLGEQTSNMMQSPPGIGYVRRAQSRGMGSICPVTAEWQVKGGKGG